MRGDTTDSFVEDSEEETGPIEGKKNSWCLAVLLTIITLLLVVVLIVAIHLGLVGWKPVVMENFVFDLSNGTVKIVEVVPFTVHESGNAFNYRCTCKCTDCDRLRMHLCKIRVGNRDAAISGCEARFAPHCEEVDCLGVACYYCAVAEM